jgi:hypothetical protein
MTGKSTFPRCPASHEPARNLYGGLRDRAKEKFGRQNAERDQRVSDFNLPGSEPMGLFEVSVTRAKNLHQTGIFFTNQPLLLSASRLIFSRIHGLAMSFISRLSMLETADTQLLRTVGGGGRSNRDDGH